MLAVCRVSDNEGIYGLCCSHFLFKAQRDSMSYGAMPG